MHTLLNPREVTPLRNAAPARIQRLAGFMAALFVAFALSGCMGQHMTRSGPEGDVQIVDITPEVVRGNLAAMPTLPSELMEYHPDNYRIQTGDVVQVTVWDHPELTTPAGTMQEAATNGRLVYPDGTMFFPYAGTIKAEGMTIQELRSTLTSRLAKYLRNPQLDLNVVNHAGMVTMQGAFTNTAPQNLTTVPLTVSRAVGAAGINIEEADLSGLVLTRDGKSYTLDMDAIGRMGGGGDIYLKPGDRLFLPFNDRKEIYVMGEVIEPQALNFKTSDVSLTQALGRVGGLDQITSNGDAVYVIRGLTADQLRQSTAPGATQVYRLQADSPAAFGLASGFSLRPGDVVFVGAAGITRWSRFVTQLLPLSSVIRNTADATNDL